MRPLMELERSEAARLRGLLFDLDDTLLDEGKLSEAAYSALFRLREAGLELYVVTGRPLGWVRLLTRLWPLDGGVAENGGALVTRGELVEPLPAREREARRAKLDELVRAIEREFPELEPVTDPSERLTDFAFDIGEERRVEPALAERAAAFARRAGATVTISSVHLHVGLDPVDKASGAVRLLRVLKGVDPTAALARYAFIGDSGNDAACFAAFKTSIGVANLAGRPTLPPRFRTSAARGAGFAEAARILSSLRASAE